METIHFGSYDARFCGSTVQGRRFTPDPNEVTCGPCKGQDTLTLSPSGLQMLRELGYVNPDGSIR